MRVVELLLQIADLGLGLVRALDRIAAARRLGLELALIGRELSDVRLELDEPIASLGVLRRRLGDPTLERLDLRGVSNFTAALGCTCSRKEADWRWASPSERWAVVAVPLACSRSACACNNRSTRDRSDATSDRTAATSCSGSLDESFDVDRPPASASTNAARYLRTSPRDAAAKASDVGRAAQICASASLVDCESR